VLLYDPGKEEVTIIDLPTRQERKLAFTDKALWKNNFLFHEGKFYSGAPGFGNMSFEWTPEGIVTAKHPEFLEEIVKRFREKEQPQTNDFYSSTPGSLLKNITTVYLNTNHNLVFNKHEFLLTKHNIFFLALTKSTESLVAATQSSEGEFIFPGGSSIVIDRAGMLIFNCNDSSIEKIFVPSALGMSLGVSTSSAFSGNDYFLPPESLLNSMKPSMFFEKHIAPFVTTIINGA
jgi:hypothetical protein